MILSCSMIQEETSNYKNPYTTFITNINARCHTITASDSKISSYLNFTVLDEATTIERNDNSFSTLSNCHQYLNR